MKELTEKTRAVAKKMPIQWSTPIRFIDLVEEIGELANALLGEWQEKPPLGRKDDVEDALCDILYDLLLLSHDFDIDLEKSYLKSLKKLDERIKKGEFDIKSKS